jgi:hypothetical protein
MVELLLATLCGFVSRTFPNKGFATTLEGRINVRSPSHRSLILAMTCNSTVRVNFGEHLFYDVGE